VADLSASVVRHLGIAMLQVLDVVVDVHEVIAVHMVVGIEGATKGGALVVILPHHLLVLRLRVPAHVVTQVDASHAHRRKVSVVGIAVLPDVILTERVKDAQQVIRLSAHQVMVLAVAAGHFDLMLVREHPYLLQPLVGTPNDERHLEAHRRLHWKHRLTCEAGPVHATQFAKGGTCDVTHGHGVHVLDHDVAVELDAQVSQVADAQRRVEVLVVCHQQWVHAQSVLDCVDYEVAVVASRDRDDAVISAPRFNLVGRDEVFQLLPTDTPIQGVLLFVDTATAANAFVVQLQTQWMED